MNTAALRSLIQQAQSREKAHGELATQIGRRRAALHRTICLDEGDAERVLGHFVNAYIEQVPALIEAAQAVAIEAGIGPQLRPVLQQAEAFFLRALPEQHPQLIDLLDEVYLAHRLIEEVNDRYIAHLGQPLIPLDTTLANLIAYQLIGEAVADQLDQLVQIRVTTLITDKTFSGASLRRYREKLANPRTLAAWQRWPCLSRQLGVSLQLSAERQPG